MVLLSGLPWPSFLDLIAMVILYAFILVVIRASGTVPARIPGTGKGRLWAGAGGYNPGGESVFRGNLPVFTDWVLRGETLFGKGFP